MDRIRKIAFLSVLVILSAVLAAAAGKPWPRVKTAPDGTIFILYQPQVDAWEGYVTLRYRLAVEIYPQGSSDPVPAALEMTADTNTDLSTRTVVVYNQKVVGLNFPSIDEATGRKLTGLVRSIIPSGPMKMSVDDILACTSSKKDSSPKVQAAAVNVSPAPPEIIVSESPSILILYDGGPKFAPIEGTGLQFALNSSWDVLKEEGSETVYLLYGESWISAPGPQSLAWGPAPKLPPAFGKIPDIEMWANVRKNIPGKAITKNKVPRVFVSEKPAELIQTDGAPAFKAVGGTKLSWASNTESDLFRDDATGAFYYLTSGRWFSAPALGGPWKFAGDSLPADFAKIPEDHPKAAVRVSVPGTREANEAVELAQAPHKAEVKKDQATVEVKYAGDPVFLPVEGTSMTYAVNTQNDVVKLGDRYYCCYQAVWFSASSPSGPWYVTDKVPPEIYKIPPSCPVYNVTYVTIYDYTATTVVTGYTSGYYGEFIVGGVVVYGTGFYYPPYFYYPPGFYYPFYYPRPWTYGFAAFYNPYAGVYARGWAACGPYWGRGYAEAYNPYTGAYGQRAWGYGPGGQVGYAARGYNPSTGIGGATYQRANPYASWGESVITKGDDWVHTGHYTDSRGTAAGFETSGGAKGGGVRTDDGRTAVAKDKDNNIYAAHDGNVYKNDGDSWQKYDDGGWTDVDRDNAKQKAENRREADNRSSDAFNEVQRDKQARSDAERRAENAGSKRSGQGTGVRGSGSGSFRGGGRRR